VVQLKRLTMTSHRLEDGFMAAAITVQVKEHGRCISIELQRRGESFRAFALRQSKAHAETFRAQPLSAAEEQDFERMARASLAEQAELEVAPAGDFDSFVAAYQASILGISQ